MVRFVVFVVVAAVVVGVVALLQVKQEKESIHYSTMGQVICPPSRSARDTAPDDSTSNNMSGVRDNTAAVEAATVAASSQRNKVLVDYQNGEYKGFVFVIHQQYGLMLLYCTRKKKKPPHWQLCGGKLDEPEFIKAGKSRKKRCRIFFSERNRISIVNLSKGSKFSNYFI
jgi:hypothetical protein